MARKRSVEYVMISKVAERFDIHPQTLRLYEREGLLQPARSSGNTRLYDQETLRRLEIILNLTRELGVNLAGVEVILNMREQMVSMRQEMEDALEEARREIVERRAAEAKRHALVRFESAPLAKV